MNDANLKIAYKNTALTIAGSDSGGNAGIQADLRAFQSFGVHGCTAITALTAQNPRAVNAILTADSNFILKQLDAVISSYEIRALKTGMLCNAEIIAAVAGNLTRHKLIKKVFDPVMISTSGAKLLNDDAHEQLKKSLLPLATLITPNLPESEILLGRELKSCEQIADGAKEIFESFGCATLIKGGHNSTARARDLLYDGEHTLWFESPVVINPLSTHGTGCSLSAAITASLANGRLLHDAIKEGKAYLYASLRSGVKVGREEAVLGTPEELPLDKITLTNFKG